MRVDVLAGRDVPVAKPMIWPNFRTGSPLAIARVAILWPRMTRAAAVTPWRRRRAWTGSIATIRLSLALGRIERGAVFSGLTSHRASRGVVRRHILSGCQTSGSDTVLALNVAFASV